MSNHITTDSNMSTNNNKTVADELYRIHCYAETLAKLCSTSSHSNPITPEHLQQIFKDIASVTDIASARFYKLSE
ncbi:hypothetical protein [Psychrobacter urativorans]|uniref:Uncharacterized protein n=1 Tax=Psychrobacter urativorans TaxID=45610 RepID=A0A0M3V944_9GAMM|nr:hypothetical protein [Psychrobacter urativorans]ALF60303.1 hypothetical protein AOC03_09860 [Psychrobacter urativorans]